MGVIKPETGGKENPLEKKTGYLKTIISVCETGGELSESFSEPGSRASRPALHLESATNG
jgi:hypothetical protein